MHSGQRVIAQKEERTSYPAAKTETIKKVEELAKIYDTIIVSKLEKVRASQLMLLRKNFKGELVMLVAKNKIAGIGLGRAGAKHADEFSKLEGQNALIFTDMNPFKLYLSLEKSKVSLPARAGDIATDEITVPAGNTGIPPGPVLSEFKEANVATRIESGSIYVSKDSVVARPGDKISPKLAGLLSRLNLKPIKAGMSIFMASSDGLLLLQKDIVIDLEQYRRDVSQVAAEAMALAVEAAYTTPETMSLLLAKGFKGAREVARESGYVTSETADAVLGLADAQARAVLTFAKNKGYTESST